MSDVPTATLLTLKAEHDAAGEPDKAQAVYDELVQRGLDSLGYDPTRSEPVTW